MKKREANGTGLKMMQLLIEKLSDVVLERLDSFTKGCCGDPFFLQQMGQVIDEDHSICIIECQRML
ncbi:hypothetical protein ACQKNS_22450 [Peribacillus sp. NPDC094092]|uniref:hypothetical protein n=1 Tax=Peribacillus sp. NPDC094092 TaxID=3390611 RepID=UPI003D043F08